VKRCFLSLLLFFSSLFHLAAQQMQASRGLMDLKNWNFRERGNIKLNGEWEFYMHQLITPDSIAHNSVPKDYLNFPSTWNELSMSKHPGRGYATYRLRVLLSQAEPLSLEIPHFYSNYKLWINGNLAAKNGTVGVSDKLSVPQWHPQTIIFTPDKDTLDIVIQVSNFHHAKGGVREAIWLGEPEQLGLKRNVAIGSSIFLIACLVLTGVGFVLVYMFANSERSALYFAALCITWAIRSAFSNLYPVTVLLPDLPWELCVKIEYITLYLMMIWAILFLNRLFPQDVNSFFKYFLFSFNMIFIAFTVFFRASSYTQFLPVYLSFCLILLLYIVYVLIRAVVYERQGVWLIVGCIMLGVIIFAYDLMAYEGMASFNSIIINLGYFVMFALMAWCLAYQFGFLKRSAHSRDMLSYEDLYGK
jgi:hypothetical protein